MIAIYENRWGATNGVSPNAHWKSFISRIGWESCKRIINRCREQLRDGNRFPPTLGEVEAMLFTRSRYEYEQAFARFQSKKPEGNAERWVYEKCGWNLKRVAAGRELQEFTRYLKQADNLELRGELVLPGEELLRLPKHSSVSVTDKVREEYAQSGRKHRLSERIKQIRSMR